MITRARTLAIQKLARETLHEYRAFSLPVKPKALAEEKLEIPVVSLKVPSSDVSGVLMKIGDTYGIGYSESIANQGFQNFTVAHELGHYFIAGHPEALLVDGKHFSRSGFISTHPLEREADTFAAEFLMPWQLIEPLIRSARRGLPAIKALSDACESSLLASAIRYAERTKECVAVILSYQGKVEFMVASDAFREIPGILEGWLKREHPIPFGVPSRNHSKNPVETLAFSIIEEGSKLSDWFSAAPNLEVEEDIVGMGRFGRLMTILISDFHPDEEEEDEEEEDDCIDRWKRGIFRGKR